MKQSTIYWIWVVGSLVWLGNSAIVWHTGRRGHAAVSFVIAILFFAAALQSRRKGKLPE
ncbi:MAG TPA: hypothetical protein VM554_01185 [Acidisarcina sp.]|nr:hypothetical protein [Acidisarcina sp.]